MKCTSCGKELKDGVAFCNGCGAKVNLEPVAATLEKTQRFCPECGATLNSENDLFCVTCGVQIGGVPNQSSAQNQPPVPAPNKTQVHSTANNRKSQKKKRKTGRWVAAAIVLLLVGGVVAVNFVNPSLFPDLISVVTDAVTGVERDSDIPENGTKSDPVETEIVESTPLPETKTPAPVFNMAVLEKIIAAGNSSANVAVAIFDVNTRQEYYTKNAVDSFVASGFYAPIYAAAYSSDNTDNSLKSRAVAMITTMDNASANAIIDGLGGMSATNDILNKLGYYTTTFNRRFGDTEASRLGYENYTSAKEAALILGQLYYNGGYTGMSTNLGDEGIRLPDDVTVFAHRGYGIGTTYNVFMVVVSPSATYTVAILTDGAGHDADTARTNSVPIISDLLWAIDAEI
jgi:hypothetical protein